MTNTKEGIEKRKAYQKEYCRRPDVKKKAREHYHDNKEEISKRRKIVRQKNKDKISERGKKYYQENKEDILKRQNKRYQEKKEEILKQQKEYRQKNPEKVKEIRKRCENKPEIKARKKEQSRKYHQKHKKKRDDHVRLRKKTDKNFAIKIRLKDLLRHTFKYYTKTGKIWSASKYGIDYKKIIESLKPFPKDIENYHLDHIKPLCSFTFINEDGSTDLEEIRKAFAPENLQWLTAHENIVKGGRCLN